MNIETNDLNEATFYLMRGGQLIASKCKEEVVVNNDTNKTFTRYIIYIKDVKARDYDNWNRDVVQGNIKKFFELRDYLKTKLRKLTYTQDRRQVSCKIIKVTKFVRDY